MPNQHLKRHNYVLLLSGGSGTRFWPQSRIGKPKQFLPLLRGSTLFEATLRRIKPLFLPQNIFVSTHQRYRRLNLSYLAPFRVPSSNVICETVSKNTAPSIAAAVHLINAIDPLARVCVLPCDHLVRQEALFRKLVTCALDICEKQLVIFGIPPTRPATGYGYIKVRALLSNGNKIYQVDRFLEKPDLKTARRFCTDKKYFWNSGMFAGTSAHFLQEIERFMPDCFLRLQRVKSSKDLKGFWEKCKAVSFDCAVMEKARQVSMISADGLGWSDVGSWRSYDEQLKKDSHGNYFKGSVEGIDCRNATVLGKERFIACIGLSELIVVDTPEALLIAHKEKTEEIKRIVAGLRSKKSALI